MRLFKTKQLRIAPLLAAVAMAAGVAMISSGAKAQTAPQTKIGDIRLGGYFPIDKGTQDRFDSVFPAGGLDYIIKDDPGASRYLLGVDYIERSAGQDKITIIPVTISEQIYPKVTNKSLQPFFGLGVGAYFLKFQEPDNGSLGGTTSPTSLGGFGEAGVDLSSSVFLDVRYHYVAEKDAQNASGFEGSVGLRF